MYSESERDRDGPLPIPPSSSSEVDEAEDAHQLPAAVPVAPENRPWAERRSDAVTAPKYKPFHTVHYAHVLEFSQTLSAGEDGFVFLSATKLQLEQQPNTHTVMAYIQACKESLRTHRNYYPCHPGSTSIHRLCDGICSLWRSIQ